MASLRRRVRVITWLWVALSLTACLTPSATIWPDEVPRRQVFVQAWLEDDRNQALQPQEDYLGWVRSFYTGTVVYPRGWLDIEADLLERVDNESRPSLDAELERLGIAIGSEWAKLNEDRVIDNRILALWGSILQMASIDQKQLEAVALIARDVELLHQHLLQKPDVVESRYTEPLDLEEFGF